MRFYRDGISFTVAKKSLSGFRYAVAVPARYGNAVKRNKLRRRIKEIVRLTDHVPDNIDLIFAIRKPCDSFSYDRLCDICNWAIDRIHQRFSQVEISA